MAWRSAGSLTRSLSRASSLRSPPPMPRLRPPQSASRHHPLRFSSPRNLGELGCTASFLPFTSVARISSHLTVNVRAYSELSHGTFCRTCQDR
ncbi:hypothetical protein Ddye_003526 [Dipteronia dyeriana]|uniref:Uncharacterized protein n=1 Tax=Dipteronia dyeriana TaxID=168575 RepID=A0AAD9XTN2_9ROSI|nr:hypothetical protein Ddye_003526 [Dipteronia dyeriana]